ncbi:MAG: ATP-binding protein [Bacteroidales bacterium]|nr:ATP-binding protein [Bacteroidales bacterium]
MRNLIIGREQEQNKLQELYDSETAEFLVVYGRRRSGKTFLIREYFEEKFTFFHTALSPFEMADNNELLAKQQLRRFGETLRSYGSMSAGVPEDWFEAFDRLKELLMRQSKRKRLTVFIDELPWLDTPRSGFVTAFENFWNGWGAGRHNLFLIVCGSATSWISNKLLNNTGGLYGRSTCEMQIVPFTLYECEKYYQRKGLSLDCYDQLQAYMITGGIPYYMSYFQKGLSLAQNVDNLFFKTDGKLTGEFERLYGSLFVDSQKYISVVKILGSKRGGMTRKEIAESLSLNSGGGLTEILRGLQASNFIIQYTDFGGSKREVYYKLSDLFSLFYLYFSKFHKVNSPTFWADNLNSPQLNAWRGLAFEQVCFVHQEQIKRALGISGVNTNIMPWRNSGENGVQIDMVIDRDDRVVNICEMKFSSGEFSIDRDYDMKLRRKVQIFTEKLKVRKNPHLTVITTFGLQKNEYSGHIQKCITADDLFKE